MVVVVVGPDGAGKTTVVEHVVDILSLQYRKASAPKNQGELFEKINSFLNEKEFEQKGKHLVWDRWYYPDDIVYLPVVQKKKSLLPTYAKIIENRLARFRTVFLYVCADLEVLEARYDRDGDWYIAKDHLKDILQNYEDFFATTTLPYFRLDTTEVDKSVTKRRAEIMIKEAIEHENSYYRSK